MPTQKPRGYGKPSSLQDTAKPTVINISAKVQRVPADIAETISTGKCCQRRVASNHTVLLLQLRHFFRLFYDYTGVTDAIRVTFSKSVGVPIYLYYPYSVAFTSRLMSPLFIPVPPGVYADAKKHVDLTHERPTFGQIAEWIKSYGTYYEEDGFLYGYAVLCQGANCQPYIIKVKNRILQVSLYMATDEQDIWQTLNLVSPVELPEADRDRLVRNILSGEVNVKTYDHTFAIGNNLTWAYSVLGDVYVKHTPVLHATRGKVKAIEATAVPIDVVGVEPLKPDPFFVSRHFGSSA